MGQSQTICRIMWFIWQLTSSDSHAMISTKLWTELPKWCSEPKRGPILGNLRDSELRDGRKFDLRLRKRICLLRNPIANEKQIRCENNDDDGDVVVKKAMTITMTMTIKTKNRWRRCCGSDDDSYGDDENVYGNGDNNDNVKEEGKLKLKKQVHSDNDGSEVDILGHLGTF